jgi:hypothetical protein
MDNSSSNRNEIWFRGDLLHHEQVIRSGDGLSPTNLGESNGLLSQGWTGLQSVWS